MVNISVFFFVVTTLLVASCGAEVRPAFVSSATRTTTATTRTHKDVSLWRTTLSFSSSSIGNSRNTRVKLYGENKKENEQSSSSNKPSESSSSSSSPSSNMKKKKSVVAKPNHQFKDIVIVGGGLAGLSAALYVSQMAPERHVTVLERQDCMHHPTKTTVASMAAAGMLAPQSERLPKGPLLDLCLQSRRLYPDFCHLVETLASQEHVSEYWSNDNNNDDSSDDLKPWSVGYMASGGFLAPAFAGDSVATWAPPDHAGTASWLDATQVRELEPNLHPKVVGGWWFPEDASVDARRLTHSLRAACVAAGVQLCTGPNYQVSSLDLEDGTCRGLWLQNTGTYIHAKSILVANGAWMRSLLPVPIEPHKGQSLSLRMPPNQPPLLKRVLFAQDSYIVPKANGRIVVGATVEAGSYNADVTPAGLLHILGHALELVPGLAHLAVEETWVGLRPTTPDKGPILGHTPWKNLFLAGGYWRNGVLLAPKTGQLAACLLAGLELDESDQALLDAFAWDRFTSAKGGTQLAANARYAASMHPIHQRTSGAGVAASVGTELGVYSDASSAAQEREQDRKALWGTSSDDENDENEDDAFERAAQMGISDFDAFIFDDDDDDDDDDTTTAATTEPEPEQREYMASLNPSVTTPFEGSADAFTVPGYSVKENETLPKVNGKAKNENNDVLETNGMEDHENDDSVETMQDDDEFWPKSDKAQSSFSETTTTPSNNNKKNKDLTDIYKQIKSNKEKQTFEMPASSKGEDKPDPGFRIYRVDEVTGKSFEIPPFTTPQEMTKLMSKMQDENENDDETKNDKKNNENGETTTSSSSPLQPSSSFTTKENDEDNEQEYNEETFDGYTAIQQANARGSREEELKAMKESRLKNRVSASEISMKDIGVHKENNDDNDTNA